MSLSGSSRGAGGLVRSRHFGFALGLALLAAALLVSPARGRTVPDLSGVWINTRDNTSRFALFASADRTKLTASWHGGAGPHAGLVGSFTGTLNANGNKYTGPMQVSEAGNPPVSGTMTWTLNQLQVDFHFGYPQLDVTYQQANGVGGSFSLELWLLPARVAPSAKPAVEFEYNCPTMGSYCEGVAYGGSTGSAMSPDLPGTGAAAARAPRSTIVGSARFRVRGGRSARLGFALNKTGRRLLATRGSLGVRVQIRMNKSSGLPRVTDLGTVTFHRR